MVITDLILLSMITVFIVDISGAIGSLKSGLKWIFTKGTLKSDDYRLKPIDCSLCMTFWIGIFYLLIVGHFTIPYFTFVCILSCFSGVIKSTILLVEDIFVKIIQLTYKTLGE